MKNMVPIKTKRLTIPPMLVAPVEAMAAIGAKAVALKFDTQVRKGMPTRVSPGTGYCMPCRDVVTMTVEIEVEA